MQINRVLAGALLPLFLSIPAPTLAATPSVQQVLNSAVKNEFASSDVSYRLAPSPFDETDVRALMAVIKPLIEKTPALLATKAESKTKNAAGEDVWRIRGRVNPLLLNAVYRKDKTFAPTRKILMSAGMVAFVNVSRNRIERLELGGSSFAMGITMLKPAPVLEIVELPAPVPETPVTLPETPPVPPAVYNETRDHALGALDAKVTVMIYDDFQNPFAAAFDANLKRLLAEFPQDVRVVYRHFPLPSHLQATAAAEASECAWYLGGNSAFWRFHDLLLATTPSAFDATLYSTYAGQLGLDRVKFNELAESGVMTIRVHSDLGYAADSGVTSVPATLINGKLFQGVMTYETLKSEAMKAGAKQ